MAQVNAVASSLFSFENDGGVLSQKLEIGRIYGTVEQIKIFQRFNRIFHYISLFWKTPDRSLFWSLFISVSPTSVEFKTLSHWQVSHGI